jgi:C1A family cysteine protease
VDYFLGRKMKNLVNGLVLFLLAATVSGAKSVEDVDDLHFRFQKFIVRYNKTYLSNSEYTQRFKIYCRNIAFIAAHNEQESTWTMAENEFADLSWNEFRSTRLGFGVPNRHPKKNAVSSSDLSQVTTCPDTVDWCKKNAVTPIKNQGQCGSCWAFSTTGSIEGAFAIKTGTLKSFSEQELVDCSQPEGNMGCNGGLMDYGFEYAEEEGLCLEDDYSYEAFQDTCRKSSCSKNVQVKNFVDVKPCEVALKHAVAGQPVSVAIEADQPGFQFYSSGVFTAECGTALDHGVLVVGYGTLDNTLYWKVKNSWGASWGMNGYIFMERTETKESTGKCGIAMQPSYPIV